MPKTVFEPEKKDNGTFASLGLSSKKFGKLFKKIEQAQKKARRSAKRTLTPSIFTNPTTKALKALGEKAKGARFTKNDLVKFDKNRQRHKEKYDSKTAGITYAFLVNNSRKIDIDRANNRVDDGTGITKATLFAIKGNVALIRVKASNASKHEEHQIKVRFEQWDELIQSPPDGDYIKAAQLSCAGRISFDCDCGRHQYWYRYLATMGNYAIAPPKEFAFPKIKNPELQGVACKHVLKSSTMLQSLAWHRILAKQMEVQAKRVGYGSDNRTHTLNQEEQKAAAKNRKTKVDKSAAEKEHDQYLRSQRAMDRKLAKQKHDGERATRQSRRIRKQNNKINELSDMLKVGFHNFADTYKVQGKTKQQAITDFAKLMNVSEGKLKGLVK